MKITIKYPRSYGCRETKSFSFEWKTDKKNGDVLQGIFDGFNHGSAREWQIFLRSKVRSMSVGDFVQLGNDWYQCAPVGWRKVTEDRVNQIMSLSAYDTWKDEFIRNI